MAAFSSKVPYFMAIRRCGGALPRPMGAVANVTSTVLPNKVVVATAESALPVARVSVVFRAGSRYESYENLGAAHMLRIATGLSTKNSSSFAITRNLQEIGANLTVTTDREVVAYTVEATANNIDVGLQFLQDVVQPAFKPWELEDNIPRMKAHVASVPPQVRAVELLHHAAFRSGLGNSIYIPEHKIGHLSSETLQHYVQNNFTLGRCAVVGVGVSHSALSAFAQNLDLPQGEGKPPSANYYSGVARIDTNDPRAHVAIGGAGGALLNKKESLAFGVLQHAVGVDVPATHGSFNGKIAKAVFGAVGDAPISMTALNAVYTDTGIFGVLLSVDGAHAGKAMEAVTRALRANSIPAEDVKRAKALLTREVLEAYSTDRSLVEEMGVQAVLSKQVHNVDALVADINALTEKDVQGAMNKAFSSKISFGAIGNLITVPYVAESLK